MIMLVRAGAAGLDVDEGEAPGRTAADQDPMLVIALLTSGVSRPARHRGHGISRESSRPDSAGHHGRNILLN